MELVQVDRTPQQAAPLETILAPSCDELLAGVRDGVARGSAILVEPDVFATVDGEIDLDEWVGLASVLVLEGVSAIRTSLPGHARRLFTSHAALVAGAVPDGQETA